MTVVFPAFKILAKLTVVLQKFSNTFAPLPVGRVSLSVTVTVNELVVVLLSDFVPTTLTVVVPMPNRDPDWGVTVTTPQVPVKVAL